ncbi:hypothetical protein EST38_g10764 [Candolleomyces aberdarensis]|uniref:Uncharacterized protein n=1 Tax=Candolleomyces aberdarensis TaxID=2316362 RepID=A0A4Q2D8U3_9AGAR|nr:hypothetical protein EST38_g10764 [Candolleomyces aberdarensis]
MSSGNQNSPRIQLLHGDLYFSPNCSRSLDGVLQPDHLKGTLHNPFHPGEDPSTVNQHELFQPRTWTRAFGWLAFLPLRPLSRGYPFQSFTPVAEQSIWLKNGGYRLSSRRMLEWLDFEEKVYHAVVSLKGRYNVAMVLPFLPWALGYRRYHSDEGTALKAANNSLNWFTVWMGALSYVIAAAEAKHYQRKPMVAYPDWCSYLQDLKDANVNFPVAWVESVSRSFIAKFDASNPRVGCIAELIDPDPTQPPIEWFVAHGVPVWYRWGKRERDAVVQGDIPQDLQPPASLIQTSSADLLSPLTQFPSQVGLTPPPYFKTMPSKKPDWIDFFEERRKSHELMIKKETPKARQAREN